MAARSRQPVSVVIADDQPVIRDGLIAILSTIDGLTVIGAAQDGAGAIALASTQDIRRAVHAAARHR